MSRYIARLPDGRAVTVDLPARLTLTRPATDAEAHVAIGTYVAGVVRPHLSAMPPLKRIDRGPNGEIARIVEVPAATADELAGEVGRQIARELLREDEP